MAVSIEDVRHVAALARLAPPEERLEGLARELESILLHMEVLRAAGEAEPAAAGHAETPVRDDRGAPIALAVPLTAFAPSMCDGFFLVPRLETHE